MKEDLRIYCRLEGFDELYLRADKKLSRLKKKRDKKTLVSRKCVSLKSFEEQKKR